MPLTWNALRTLRGSQQAAFEELCCQLAAHEPVPAGARLTRVGAPDAGVECYWTLPNGEEWGWQAKFFTSALATGQWQQVEDSFVTAIEKRPRLTVYTICMPIDRQDPRLERQAWMMDKWNERVDRWTRLAREKGRTVDIRYWGEHEIWDRLELKLADSVYRSVVDRIGELPDRITGELLLFYERIGTINTLTTQLGALSEDIAVAR
jgi:hypothetical protein